MKGNTVHAHATTICPRPHRLLHLLHRGPPLRRRCARPSPSAAPTPPAGRLYRWYTIPLDTAYQRSYSDAKFSLQLAVAQLKCGESMSCRVGGQWPQADGTTAAAVLFDWGSSGCWFQYSHFTSEWAGGRTCWHLREQPSGGMPARGAAAPLPPRQTVGWRAVPRLRMAGPAPSQPWAEVALHRAPPRRAPAGLEQGSPLWSCKDPLAGEYVLQCAECSAGAGAGGPSQPTQPGGGQGGGRGAAINPTVIIVSTRDRENGGGACGGARGGVVGAEGAKGVLSTTTLPAQPCLDPACGCGLPGLGLTCLPIHHAAAARPAPRRLPPACALPPPSWWGWRCWCGTGGAPAA